MRRKRKKSLLSIITRRSNNSCPITGVGIESDSNRWTDKSRTPPPLLMRNLRIFISMRSHTEQSSSRTKRWDHSPRVVPPPQTALRKPPESCTRTGTSNSSKRSPTPLTEILSVKFQRLSVPTSISRSSIYYNTVLLSSQTSTNHWPNYINNDNL